MENKSKTVTIFYTNWRGENGWRKIVPQEIFWGSNEWHTAEQWLMNALDIDKNEGRIFALKDIHEWKQE